MTSLTYIRGIRVRIPQELDVVAFCPLKKRLGITMPWLICLRFSMSWFYGLGISMSWLFGLGISMSWFFGLGISMSWFFGLGISISWYMCLHRLAFIIIVKSKKSRIFMSIILLKNTSVVQIYATSICIMMHQRIRIMNRIF